MKLPLRTAPFAGPMLFAVVVIGVGAVAITIASGYSFGRLNDIGPGFTPVALATVLCVLGAMLVVECLRERKRTAPVRLAPMVLISAGIVAWGVLVERFGLVPATVVLVAFYAAADRPVHPVTMVLTAVALSAFGVAVFVYGFRLPFSVFAW